VAEPRLKDRRGKGRRRGGLFHRVRSEIGVLHRGCFDAETKVPFDRSNDQGRNLSGSIVPLFLAVQGWSVLGGSSFRLFVTISAASRWRALADALTITSIGLPIPMTKLSSLAKNTESTRSSTGLTNADERRQDLMSHCASAEAKNDPQSRTMTKWRDASNRQHVVRWQSPISSLTS
jgi:hypothetical protein